MLSALHKFLHSLRTAMPRPFIRPLVSMPVLTPRINFRYLKNSTWSIPINPNQKTCYCNAQINFQEQHNRSDINKTWTPIMSQQMTNQKTYQRRTPKKNYNTFFRLNFVTCLPKHSTVTLSRASPSLIIKEGIPRWLCLKWSDASTVMYHHQSPEVSDSSNPKKKRGTWKHEIQPYTHPIWP